MIHVRIHVRRLLFILASSIALALPALIGTTPSAKAQCVQSPLAGQWVAINQSTRGLTRAEIEGGCCDQQACTANGCHPVCSPPDRVRIFGRCHPNDCDWGQQSGNFQQSNGSMKLQYDQGFATRAVTITSLPNQRLRIRVQTHFTSPGRPDYTLIENMRH